MVVLVPEGLAELGARQFGLLSRRQALEHWTPDQLGRRVAQGVVTRQGRGVYRLAGAQASWRQRALAATLSTGPPVAVCGLAAAHLWQVERIAAPPITVAVPRHRSGRGAGGVIRCPLPGCDVDERYGIPVTTAARTVIDLSRLLSPALLGLVADDLIRRRLLEVAHLEARLAAGEPLGRHCPGVVGAVCAARRGDERRGASAAEDWVWDAIARAGLPLPVRHYPVWLAGRWVELDFAYPPWRVALEYDSAQFHRDLRRFHGDRARAADLAVEDWLLLSVTAEWTEEVLVARLRRAFCLRGLR